MPLNLKLKVWWGTRITVITPCGEGWSRSLVFDPPEETIAAINLASDHTRNREKCISKSS